MSADSSEITQLAITSTGSQFLEKARRLLHKRLKVVVNDGRVLVGDFLCIDKQGNLILGNTYQQVPGENLLSGERLIGQVLVPAAQRTTCHIEVMPSERPAMSLLLPMVFQQ
eukprot:GDKK01033097.1.p1 GENE.GDKK01033097.1~~GDKK01033097.1.p1  ORF type:complete len:120 (-),score=10.76 GDKK01033097.1:34-369(-)